MKARLRHPLTALLGVGLALSILALLSSATRAREAATAEPKPDTRGALRMFYTAPPAVPHIIRGQGSEQCMYCHSEVRHIGERTTVLTPHSGYRNCQQCHVGQVLLNEGAEAPVVASAWAGLAEPREGVRLHELAPPTIPHRVFMRENCNACHGPENPTVSMRGPHPDRTSCRQCHIPDLEQDF